MAGQIIRLPGVTSGAAAGAARIEMSATDIIASRMPELLHVVKASKMRNTASAGMIGQCLATGKPLLMSGANLDRLDVQTIAGFPGMGLSTGVGAAAIKLPVGSAKASYTVLMSVYIGPVAATFNGAVSLIGSYTSADVALATILRGYGTVSASFAGKVVSAGGDSTTTFAQQNQPVSGTWGVIAIDWDNAGKIVGIAVNNTTFNEASKPSTSHAADAGSYVSLGNPTGTSAFRDDRIGAVYLFDRSLRATEMGKSQLASLIIALKAEYGIA